MDEAHGHGWVIVTLGRVLLAAGVVTVFVPIGLMVLASVVLSLVITLLSRR